MKIKSFKKDQGFGYIAHPDHGDLLFDYVACNFEPEEGDEIEILEMGKRYNGAPKATKVVCPAKPPKR